MDMNNPPNKTADLLARVKEGMHVEDYDGESVGDVTYVQFGDEDLATNEAETATSTTGRMRREDSLVDNLREAFVGDDHIPGEIVERLERTGFVRVDAGLFQRDYFIQPDQIASVDESNEEVRLTVGHDKLLKR